MNTMPKLSLKKRMLREYNNNRPKKARTAQASEQAEAENQVQVSDSDSSVESDVEYEPITIPDCSENENLLDEEYDRKSTTLSLNEVLKDDGKSAGFCYSRGPETSRQTQWRMKKKEEALKAAAVGSASIATMFAAQGSTSTKINTISPLPTKVIIRDDAITDLEVRMGKKRKSKKTFLSLNPQTQARHQAVLHFLYAQRHNPDHPRKDLALNIAHSFNRGTSFARGIAIWERSWVQSREIPAGQGGVHTKISSLFNDEEVKLFVMEFVASKKEEITAGLLAKAVTEFVGSQLVGEKAQRAIEDSQNQPGNKKEGVRIGAARKWLMSMGYTWRAARKDVYVDGHEREDVVNHRKEFVSRFKDLESRLARWDDEGNFIGDDVPPGGGKWVVVVTHDESTFHVNDGRRQMWLKDKGDPLRPKGNGKGIMMSDFLTPNGRLQAPSQITEDILMAHNVPREATTFFEYGKDNYWTGEKMAAQTLDVAVPLFEVVFPRNKFQGLFLFDNATNHRVMADDALDVAKMNLKPGGKSARMRSTWNSFTQEVQQMVFPDGTPKGIRQVLIERNKWPPEGLRLECKPVSEHKKDNNCCAKKLLAAEPDFQKPVGLIQEKIEARGHLVMFYPKFHPELNFIEYFWGACKRFTRENCDYTMDGLRTTVPRALQSVKVSTIRKFHERTLRIMEAYRRGISFGSEDYRDKVYKSHRRV